MQLQFMFNITSFSLDFFVPLLVEPQTLKQNVHFVKLKTLSCEEHGGGEGLTHVVHLKLLTAGRENRDEIKGESNIHLEMIVTDAS